MLYNQFHHPFLETKLTILSQDYLQTTTINILCESFLFYLNINTMNLMPFVDMNNALID
jgi:hypothetical protein